MRKKKRVVTLIVLIGLLGLIACNLPWSGSGGRDNPLDRGLTRRDLDITLGSYPRMDGSTSALPLGVLIACDLLEVPCEWKVMLDGVKYPIPLSSDPAQHEVATWIGERVVHNGTHGAYVNLIEDQADLILVARLPSADELALAASLGVELQAEPIALDAFIFVLNEHNPVHGLTLEQIRGIYSGAILDWSQVGGEVARIQPYQRNANSGSHELMKALVMQDLEMMPVPHEDMVLTSMLAPIQALSTDVYGIGYSVYFYEQFMAPNEGLKLCAVDGVLPTYETIRTREYPLTAEVYAVVRKDLDGASTAYKLRDWLLSREGQDVVRESGYVPIF